MKTKQRQHRKTITIIIAITLILACDIFARKPLAFLVWNAFNSWMNGLIHWRNELDDQHFNGRGADLWRQNEEDIEVMMGRRHVVETIEVSKEWNSGVSN